MVNRYKAIREIQSGQVPISAYLSQYCVFMPSIYKRNIKMDIAKRWMPSSGGELGIQGPSMKAPIHFTLCEA